MQTSPAVVFRALVMLACLVVIPLVALFGSSLPRIVGSVLEGHWPSGVTTDGRQSPAKPANGEPGQFEPIGPPAGALPGDPAEPTVPKWQNDPLKDSLKWPADALEGPDSPIRPVGYQSPLADRSPRAGRAGESRSAGEIHQTSATLPASGVAAEAVTGGDQFKQIHERLRELGATYYLLESWGNRHDYYRFYCQMAVGGNPNCSRPFQATHSDPVSAMVEVLRQVESWQASRQ